MRDATRPSRLLGPLFPRDPLAFCEDFLQTYRAALHEPSLFPVPRADVPQRLAKLTGFGNAPFPFRTDEGVALCAALIYRVERAYDVIRMAMDRDGPFLSTHGRPEHWAFCAQLFVDTHLDAFLDIYNTYVGIDTCYDRYSLNDDEAGAPDVFDHTTEGDLLRRVLLHHKPRAELAPYCGSLPDLNPFFICGSMWFESRTSSETIWDGTMYVFFRKSQTQRCQPRDSVSVTFTNFFLYPVIETTVRQMMQVSLLGNYPWCKTRPAFRTRLMIRRSFALPFCPKATFIAMRNARWLVLYTLKEYLVYNLRFHRALHDLLYRTVDNVAMMVRNVEAAMDVGRAQIDHTSEESWLCLQTASERVYEMHKAIIAQTSTYKLRKGIFPRVFYAQRQKHSVVRKSELIRQLLPPITKRLVIDHYHAEHASVTEYAPAPTLVGEGPISPSAKMLQRATQYEQAASAALGFSDWRLYSAAMDKLTRLAMPEDGLLDLRWIALSGISHVGFIFLMDWYARYEIEELKDNTFGEMFKQFLRLNPVDLVITMAFMERVLCLDDNRVFTMSRNSVDAQLESARARYGATPPLRESLFDYYYCPVCRKWKHAVVEPGNASECASRKFDKVMLDHQNRLLCRKKAPSKSTYRRRQPQQKPNSTKKFTKIVPDISKDVARKLACDEDVDDTDETSSRCCRTPLVRQRMLGVIRRLDKCLWALCCVCLQPCLYSGDRLCFTDEGLFTCGNHGTVVPIRRRITHMDRETHMLTQAWVEAGIAVDEEVSFPCIYCRSKGKDRTRVRSGTSITIRCFEDRPKHAQALIGRKQNLLGTYALCLRHHRFLLKTFEKDSQKRVANAGSTEQTMSASARRARNAGVIKLPPVFMLSDVLTRVEKQVNANFFSRCSARTRSKHL